MTDEPRWRLPLGASVESEGVRFSVWAPDRAQVEVELASDPIHHVSMERDQQGIWTALVPGAAAGARYRYRLDGGPSFPDPYSRSQPDGVHGPSEVLDPRFPWRDQGWPGLRIQGLVIYECHVGAMTPAGTFDALIGELDRLQTLGVGALQLMPVAEFSGLRNWGYDGVYPFAPSRAYGGAAGLKRLVDAAHQRGLGVILDVVYNHLGPEGNYLRQFSPYYFTDRYHTPWGDAINFDGPHARQVRQLVLDNARYWLHEFHLDGLRLDATFQMLDRSSPHILATLSRTVRDQAPAGRSPLLIAETSENEVRYLLPLEQGGFGFDAVWADDFHHALRRYLLGDSEGYFQDYRGTLAEVAQTINQGFLFEGQWSAYQRRPRGIEARDRPAWQFQLCLQTHDQVGNRALGDRLHHALDPARYRVASALLLLLPYTPLLFMGQEFVASSPFQYFTDHSPDLGRLVSEGRRHEFRGYAAFADPARAALIPDPQDEQTFLRSKLPLDEARCALGAQVQELYRALLALRRADPVLTRQDRHGLHASAPSPDLLQVEQRGAGQVRLLFASFGAATSAQLPVTPAGAGWQVLLHTEEPRFAGSGQVPRLDPSGRMTLPPRTAVLLAASGVSDRL